MEADGAPFTPLPLSVLRFTGIQSYGYTDQRKVETDVEVTEDRSGDLSLRKPCTSQLSHDCSCHMTALLCCSLLHLYSFLFFSLLQILTSLLTVRSSGEWPFRFSLCSYSD